MTQSKRQSAGGFTLVELLTVILIISVLLALLIPVAGKVRRSAQSAAVQNQMNVIGQAIDNYFHDFHAYPGPVANINIGPGAVPALPDDQIPAIAPTSGSLLGGSAGSPALTMSENLVLGVIGGLKPNPLYVRGNNMNAAFYDPGLIFPLIRKSPISFAPGAAPGPQGLNPNLPKHYGSYMPAQDLSDGYYHDDIVGSGNGLTKAIDDTAVPEFLDKFPSRMPILYLRARTGATYDSTQAISLTNNNVITGGSRTGQYDLNQIVAYTQYYNGKPVGEGKGSITYYGGSGTAITPTPPIPYHGLGGKPGTPPTAQLDLSSVLGPIGPGYYYPFDAYAYFKNPAFNDPTHQQDVPRQKDGYILISAGADRIYGTNDDICSFGSLQQ